MYPLACSQDGAREGSYHRRRPSLPSEIVDVENGTLVTKPLLQAGIVMHICHPSTPGKLEQEDHSLQAQG